MVGCCHVRAASAAIAAFISPLAGGAANSWPITEKRRCAHRSKDNRNLIAFAKQTYLIGFENISVIPAWFSDALCRRTALYRCA